MSVIDRSFPGEKELKFPRICAHRGYSAAAPENSMAAYRAAVNNGAEEIELDVRFTKDGIPVSIHDDFLERISNGTGTVQEHTLEELKRLDFGIKFSPDYAGTRIDTLEDILAEFSRRTIINMHIKSLGAVYPEDYFRKIVALIKKYDAAEHIYFMATPEIQQLAARIIPEIPRCMSADAGKWEIVENAIKYNCQKVQFFVPCWNQEMIDKAHDHGLQCNLYFCDEPADVARIFDMGIDTILTNDYLPIAKAAKEYLANK